jgi:Domain of unknown function (DUF4157)
MKPRDIEVRIEELVLRGFPPSERYRIADAMQAELARLLTEQGLSVTNDAALEQLSADAIRLNPNAHGEMMGAQIARTVLDGLRGSLLDAGGAMAGALPPTVRDVLNSPGAPLAAEARAAMEAQFGEDFSTVRIHSDPRAADSARAVNARAYTVGRDVVFGSGQYAPATAAGQHLLAHELTHVVQQNFGEARSQRVAPAESSHVQEQEAVSVSRTIINESTVVVPRISRTSTLRLAADRNPPGWDEIHNYKHPGSVTLGLAVFKTTGMSKDFSGRYIEVAQKMLKEHGLRLDVYIHSTALKWTMPLQTIDQVSDLRMLAHQAYQDTRPRLPVIFAPMHYSTHSTGQTFSNTDWLPFVVINSEEESSDGVTLLHEMGHAAKVPGDVDKPVGPSDAVNNFMLYGSGRNDMHKKQVIALAQSYFAV